MTARVSETCACGAKTELEVSTGDVEVEAKALDSLLDAWRERHEHLDLRGPCGAEGPRMPAAPYSWAPVNGAPPLICELSAGHAGLHMRGMQDGGRAVWGDE